MNIQFIRYNQEQHANIWEEINLASPHSSFLTSHAWVEFQKSLGKESYQYLIKADDEFVGLIYLEVSRRKIAKYAYAPYGPVLNYQLPISNFQLIFEELKKFAKGFVNEHNLNYFKIDPMMNVDQRQLITDAGWKQSFAPGQAKDTWVATLPSVDPSSNPSTNSGQALRVIQENFLKSFKKDTRYYVNRARKNGVVVRRASNKDKQVVDDFVILMRDTKERKGFMNFDNSYYEKQWLFFKNQNSNIKIQTNEKIEEVGKERKKSPAHDSSLQPKAPNLCEIYVAYYEDKPIGGALMNWYNGWVNYAHGGSTSDKELAKLGGPYLLHYEIMTEAIEKGFTTYNFWGIVPGQGFSMFKKKFPGELVQYVGPFEVGSGKIGYMINRLYDWWMFRGERY